ncbi:MAG: hypothetical protein ACT4OV_05115 [Microthrixaceae bacterium]
MARDAPDPSDGDQTRPGDPTAAFEPLVRRAQVVADRGRERQRALEEAARTGSADVSSGYRRAQVLIVLTALTLLAGVLAWTSSRTDDTSDAQRPIATSTTALASTSTTAAVTTTTPQTSTSTTAAVTTTTTPPSTTTTVPGGPVVTPPGGGPGGEKPDGGAALHHTVSVGESFWEIAKQEVARVSHAPPTNAQTATYWKTLIAANVDQLVQRGNPDLILPGQVFVLPPVAGSS